MPFNANVVCGGNVRKFKVQYCSFSLEELSCKIVYQSWMSLYDYSLPRKYSADEAIYKQRAEKHFNSQIFTLSKQTLTSRSIIRMKKMIVLKSCVGSFSALRKFGADWCIFFVDHPSSKNVFLILMRPTAVSRRHTCGCNWLSWIPIWKCTLYVEFAKSAIMGDVTWGGHFSEKCTYEGGPERFSFVAISSVRRMTKLGMIVFWDHPFWACVIIRFLSLIRQATVQVVTVVQLAHLQSSIS